MQFVTLALNLSIDIAIIATHVFSYRKAFRWRIQCLKNLCIYFSNQKRKANQVLILVKILQVVHLAVRLNNAPDPLRKGLESDHYSCSKFPYHGVQSKT